MSLFRCPLCAAPLEREERVYRCPNRHSHDIAKEGYTYLLPPNQKHSAAPGDDKVMAAARRAFATRPSCRWKGLSRWRARRTSRISSG